MAAGSSSGGGGGVPPGFRFHPTDEELLHFYLKKKVTFQKFDMDVIREVDLNKIEPWDLQERCKIGSTPQNEWYFFSHKDRKYPTGSRTNRATSAGFWKATGRDKCIRNTFKKIGMRKTLVFYRGRAPHGQKTDWIMHEYRLEDSDHPSDNDPPPNEDGWVVCRVFKKKNLFKIGGNGASGEGGGGGVMSDSNTNNAAAGCESVSMDNSSSNASSFNHHQYLLLQHSQHDLNYSHIPLNYNFNHHLSNYDHHHHPLPTAAAAAAASDYDPPMMPQVKQFMSTAARDPQSCEPGNQSMLQAREEEWDPLVPTTASHHQDHSNPTSINQINQLSLRSEMDFWAYGK